VKTKRCICGKVITSQFYLCSKCQEEYGVDRTKWPEWLAFMVSDIERERRQNINAEQKEITFSDLGIDIADGSEISLH